MAKRKTSGNIDDATAAPETRNELPSVESPSISPAVAEPVSDVVTPVHEPEVLPQAANVVDMTLPSATKSPTKPRFALTPRRKRMALLAASVTFAAALGTVIGALASGGFSAASPQKPDVTAMEERKAMQQSIAHLSNLQTDHHAKGEHRGLQQSRQRAGS